MDAATCSQMQQGSNPDTLRCDSIGTLARVAPGQGRQWTAMQEHCMSDQGTSTRSEDAAMR